MVFSAAVIYTFIDLVLNKFHWNKLLNPPYAKLIIIKTNIDISSLVGSCNINLSSAVIFWVNDVGLDPDGEVPIGSVGDDGLNLN